MWRAVGMTVGVFVLAFCSSGQARAAQFELPPNGTFEIAGYVSATTGTFTVSWVPYPNFDRFDFGVGTLSVSLNGASFSITDTLGTCPVSFCGPPSLVTDNVFGTHLGPGGVSIFTISNSELTVASSVALEFFNNVDPNNPDPIGQPGDWKVIVDLPEGFSITPLPGTFALFATGLGVIGLLARRRKRMAPNINCR
jgi:hypothetical protein